MIKRIEVRMWDGSKFRKWRVETVPGCYHWFRFESDAIAFAIGWASR